MDDAGKAAAIVAPNYKPLAAGLVTWEDIVTSSCVIELHRVMYRKKLTVDTVVAHGVDRAAAQRAWMILEALKVGHPNLWRCAAAWRANGQ